MYYKLELTEEQLDCVATCCEIVHRLQSGDINALCDIMPHSLPQPLLNRMKEECFPELSFEETLNPDKDYKQRHFGPGFLIRYNRQRNNAFQIWRQLRYAESKSKGEKPLFNAIKEELSYTSLPIVKYWKHRPIPGNGRKKESL